MAGACFQGVVIFGGGAAQASCQTSAWRALPPRKEGEGGWGMRVPYTSLCSASDVL